MLAGLALRIADSRVLRFAASGAAAVTESAVRISHKRPNDAADAADAPADEGEGIVEVAPLSIVMTPFSVVVVVVVIVVVDDPTIVVVVVVDANADILTQSVSTWGSSSSGV